MDLDDYIVQVFYKVDNFMNENFPGRSLRERGPLPELRDSEVLTMEIIGESLGFETDKKLFWFFKSFYSHFFPKLTTRVTFLRQAANLWKIKEKLFRCLAQQYQDPLCILDSIPLYVCRFTRAKRAKTFKGLAAFGKELGSQTFYGFRLHVKINSMGMVQTFDLAPGNIADIRLVPELTENDSGLLVCDRAYLSKSLAEKLKASQNLELSVPITKNGKPSELPAQVAKFRKTIRRKVETVFSQWAHYFQIKKIWARDLWHLTSRILRKILAHTYSVIFCLKQGLGPLDFSKLLAY